MCALPDHAVLFKMFCDTGLRPLQFFDSAISQEYLNLIPAQR
jgi:hypothetical protein